MLSGAVAMTFLLNIDDTIFKSMQVMPHRYRRKVEFLFFHNAAHMFLSDFPAPYFLKWSKLVGFYFFARAVLQLKY